MIFSYVIDILEKVEQQLGQPVWFAILTNRVNSQSSTGSITRFAKAGFVNGNDSELVLRTLSQLGGLDGPVDDWPPVDLRPGQLSGLALLHHIAQNSGFAIVCWGLPAYSHRVLCNVGDDRWLAGTRNICASEISYVNLTTGLQVFLMLILRNVAC